MILPATEVKRKCDQPNHSRVTVPCANAGVAEGTLATARTAASATMIARARCPARRGVSIIDPSSAGTVSAPPGARRASATQTTAPELTSAAVTFAVQRIVALGAAPLPHTN